MARYEHLPIYKQALDVAVHFEKVVAGFSRYHKYTLGTELRSKSRAIVALIVKANAAPDKRPHLVTLREALDELLILMRIAKEAACLRPVGDRNPEPQLAALEAELKKLGNEIGMGPMGFVGSSMVVDCHVEIAYTHTGGMPVAIHTFCFASRRATARITPDGEVTYREDPRWFTAHYRRVGVE